MSDALFRMPRDDEHVAIVGRNGTGKSQAGFWVMSQRNLADSIHVIIDYKGEELVDQLQRARDISTSEIPKENGLYVLRAVPLEAEQDRVRTWLWKIWKRGNIGLFVDEGYMIPGEKDGPFQAILTQGRSLRIPVIALSQRPVGVNRFVFSEASHTMVFDLNDERDKDTIRMFTPKGFLDWTPDGLGDNDPFTGEKMLPKFHSRWYNKKDNSRFVLRPVPGAAEIIDAIDIQLKPKHRWL
jgi:hypothetical protein